MCINKHTSCSSSPESVWLYINTLSFSSYPGKVAVYMTTHRHRVFHFLSREPIFLFFGDFFLCEDTQKSCFWLLIQRTYLLMLRCFLFMRRHTDIVFLTSYPENLSSYIMLIFYSETVSYDVITQSPWSAVYLYSWCSFVRRLDRNWSSSPFLPQRWGSSVFPVLVLLGDGQELTYSHG